MLAIFCVLLCISDMAASFIAERLLGRRRDSFSAYIADYWVGSFDDVTQNMNRFFYSVWLVS